MVDMNADGEDDTWSWHWCSYVYKWSAPFCSRVKWFV